MAMRQLFYTTLIALSLTTTTQALELNAKAYYVAHPETDTVIFSHNENELIGPASLTKMMTLYMLFDAIKEGDKVLIIDDLLATGGTSLAATKLVEKLGGKVVELAFIVDLPDVGGKKKIEAAGYKQFSLVEFEGD